MPAVPEQPVQLPNVPDTPIVAGEEAEVQEERRPERQRQALAA